MKKKKRGGFSALLLLFCLIVAGFSGWKLYGYYRGYHDGEEEYRELTKYVEKTAEDAQKEKKGKEKCPIKVDFASLATVNEDIVAWLYIPDTSINYPVVQGEDNTFYLHHTFEKKENFSGAIFLDALCSTDFSSDNSIIYGHNLKTGAMFGELKKLYDVTYNSEADYRQHPKIWVITPKTAREYEIFAAREINVQKDTEAYMVDFARESDYALWLAEQKAASQYDTAADLSSAQPAVTLSTCTSDTEDGRFIVQAVLVQEIDP